jgi:hypothetical protein
MHAGMGKGRNWLGLLGLLAVAAVLLAAFYLVGQRYAIPGLTIGLGTFLVVTGVLHYLGYPLYQYAELAVVGVIDDIRYRETLAALERLRRRQRGEAQPLATPAQRRLGALAAGTLALGGLLLVLGALALFGMVVLSAGLFALFLAPIVAIPVLFGFEWIVELNQRAATGHTAQTKVHVQAQAEAQQLKRWGGQFGEGNRYDPAVESCLHGGDLAGARSVAQEKLQLAREMDDEDRAGMYRRYLAKLDEMEQNAL